MKRILITVREYQREKTKYSNCGEGGGGGGGMSNNISRAAQAKYEKMKGKSIVSIHPPQTRKCQFSYTDKD